MRADHKTMAAKTHTSAFALAVFLIASLGLQGYMPVGAGVDGTVASGHPDLVAASVFSLQGVGPASSSDRIAEAKTKAGKDKQQKPAFVNKSGIYPDVVVAVFDPNLPANLDEMNAETLDKKQIYPELRRAEAKRFAWKTKQALERTGVFGSVRVAPSASATSELYVLGKILRSNGEDLHLQISVVDISGKRWLTKTFKRRVKSQFFRNIKNQGQDAYAPLFAQIAHTIAKKLVKQKANNLKNLQLIAELRFGSSLSTESFAHYLKRAPGAKKSRNSRNSRGRSTIWKLVGTPAADDPMLARIRPLRVRDKLFLDDMQAVYADFNQRLDPTYIVWQKESYPIAKEVRKAKAAALWKGIAGALSAVAAANALKEGVEDRDLLSLYEGNLALKGSIAFWRSSSLSSEQAAIHQQALAELGGSVDSVLAPRRVQFENQSAELTGTFAEQQVQWIEFLARMFEYEKVPDRPL
ncbi:MAG: hypothetical protein ACR2PW_07725 [Gammaproteobacteria bacterium]